MVDLIKEHKYLEKDVNLRENLSLKQWLSDKYEFRELDEFYNNCVLGGKSIHKVFVDLLKEGYSIENVTVSGVLGMVRDIHSEFIKDK